jgi:hypothetical protein
MYVKLDMIRKKNGHDLAGHFPGMLMDALGKTAEVYKDVRWIIERSISRIKVWRNSGTEIHIL